MVGGRQTNKCIKYNVFDVDRRSNDNDEINLSLYVKEILIHGFVAHGEIM